MLYYITTTKRRLKHDKQRKHRTKTFDKNIDGNTPQPKGGIYSSNKDRTNNGSGGNNQTNLQNNNKSLKHKRPKATAQGERMGQANTCTRSRSFCCIY